MKSKSFKDLEVWQKAMELAVLCYKLTDELPAHEKYSLVDQIRRSAISITSNIAEGSKRNGTKEFLQFCGIARGSSAELETQLMLVEQIHGISNPGIFDLLTEVQKTLTKLCGYLREQPPQTTNDKPSNQKPRA